MDIQLNLAYNFWFFLAAALALVLFAWWVYRVTVPPVAESLRKLLLALRIASVLLVLFLIFEPILAISNKRIEKPIIAVLADVSSSMNLSDSSGSRAEHLQAVLSQPWLNALQKRYRVLPIAFADTSRPVVAFFADSLTFDSDGTNISQALRSTAEKLAGKNFAATIVLSDGVYNLGGDPVQIANSYPVPVFAVPFGKEMPEKDVWVDDVIANELAYANTEVPVEVVIRSTGFAGSQAMVTLSRGRVTLNSQAVRLPENLQEKRLQLQFTPKKEGLHKYRISISGLDGEITTKNNARTFYIKVLKSKLRIIVVAGSPGPDVAFLVRVLQRDQNFSVKRYVALNARKIDGGKLPTGKALEAFDCIVGIDLFASTPPPRALLDWLRSVLQKHEKPLLFLAGNVRSANELWQARDFLMLAKRPVLAAEKQVFPEATIQGIVHPILRIREDPAEVRDMLATLPPVFSPFRSIAFLPGTQVLLTAGAFSQIGPGPGAEPQPLLAAIRQGNRKVLAFMGSGFWRWHLVMQRIQPGFDFYEKLMRNSVRWLVSTEESKLFRVNPDKEIYRTGESIVFNAQAYFEDYTPRENLEVSVTVSGDEVNREIFLQGKGNGLYEGKLGVLPDGDYRYLAVAREGEVAAGADSGKFTVEPFRLEYQRTTADRQLLYKIARASGGALVPADSLGELAQSLQFADRVVTHKRDLALWQRWPLLLLLVLTLSAEWYLRKRKGML